MTSDQSHIPGSPTFDERGVGKYKARRMPKELTATAALFAIASLFTAQVAAQTVEIKSGNVIGSPAPGQMPHHMQQTQHDFARLVALETNNEVRIEILEGKRPDIPVFRMPAMAKEGAVIQATAVPSFFLPRVQELKIFEIPYLFRDAAHAARYPSSDVASEISALIESRYELKVLGHFLVARNVAITSTDEPVIRPRDFAGRYVNDDFESFAPMWTNIKPAKRYSIGYTEAVDGALHADAELDTSIGMLQNIFVQKQYTKFQYATIAPSFYTFFYTFLVNRETWDQLGESQQTGVLRAANAMQVAAFDNEKATAIYHTGLNRAVGMTLHQQTKSQRAAWETEFSDKVRDGILSNADNPEVLRDYIARIRGL